MPPPWRNPSMGVIMWSGRWKRNEGTDVMKDASEKGTERLLNIAHSLSISTVSSRVLIHLALYKINHV